MLTFVVSYRNSTSNHNKLDTPLSITELYLIEILHQTTTQTQPVIWHIVLYLIEILHQTTTQKLPVIWHIGCILSKFYIKPQHKTKKAVTVDGCILSKFYIKPQHDRERVRPLCVVSYRNSTSNHNLFTINCQRFRLYLIEILHQTTTVASLICFAIGCILSKFYIKPQRRASY